MDNVNPASSQDATGGAQAAAEQTNAASPAAAATPVASAPATNPPPAPIDQSPPAANPQTAPIDQSPPANISVAGVWQAKLSFAGGQPDAPFQATLTLDEDIISGTLFFAGAEHKAVVSGSQEGGKVTLETIYQHRMAELTGDVAPDGQSIAGVWRLAGSQTPQGQWQAARAGSPSAGGNQS